MQSKSQTDWANPMDSQQIFQLIDTVLPFEACLYYQVLPLSLQGHIFKLGVVDSHDTSALDYVRRILAYMNCSVVTQPISPDMQRSMLSAYLLHSNQSKETTDTLKSAETRIQTPLDPELSSREDGATLFLADTADSSASAEGTQHYHDTASLSDRHAEITSSLSASQSQSLETSPLETFLPVLDVEASLLSSPVEVLATLPPQQLLEELLGRVLVGGIGRLFFERQSSQGRILWSQDGVLQSVLEGLDPTVFQGVINELKRLTQLPLLPVEQSKQVEIERVYQETHLLLRLQLKPGTHGEEAMLQVLRGAALRFYQQQQLSALSRDALRLAEQLQRKVSEIRDRTRLAPIPMDVVPALEQVLQSVNQQVETLIMESQQHSPKAIKPQKE